METIQYHISLATQSLVVQGRPTGSQSNVKSASLNANSLNYFLLLPSCNYFYNEKLSFFLRLLMEKGKICLKMVIIDNRLTVVMSRDLQWKVILKQLLFT